MDTTRPEYEVIDIIILSQKAEDWMDDTARKTVADNKVTMFEAIYTSDQMTKKVYLVQIMYCDYP